MTTKRWLTASNALLSSATGTIFFPENCSFPRLQFHDKRVMTTKTIIINQHQHVDVYYVVAAAADN